MVAYFTSPTEVIQVDLADATVPTMYAQAKDFTVGYNGSDSLVLVSNTNQNEIDAILTISGVVQRDETYYTAHEAEYGL